MAKQSKIKPVMLTRRQKKWQREIAKMKPEDKDNMLLHILSDPILSKVIHIYFAVKN